jgi:WD40 repeat protein
LSAASFAALAHGRALSPPITALAFSPNGDRLIAGSQAGLSIRDGASGDVVSSHPVQMDNLHCVKFSPDGTTLAIAGGDPADTGAVELLQWPSLQRKQKLLIHNDVIYDVDFSADGSHWVAASGDDVCSVYKVGADEPVARFSKHSRGVMGAVYLPDGETIVSGSRDETLRVWQAATGENLRTLHNHSRDVLALALKRTAVGLPMIASASADLTVRFWQPTIGRMVRFARLPSTPLAIAWCAGDKLIAGCQDGAARLIDSQTVQVERTIPLSDSWLYAVAVDPINDRRVFLGTDDGRVLDLSLVG